MEEIFIEEKKYISSKRAAKITGYAKDYIGQLCREGRVPARLVGRNWYVLETAIQDHRFGDSEVIELKENAKIASSVPVLPPTWETPRYESSPESEGAQDSWRAWFDRFDSGAAEKGTCRGNSARPCRGLPLEVEWSEKCFHL